MMALHLFCVWFANNDGLFIWGNGSVFDVGILEAALKAVGTPSPWNFQNVRDTRTLWAVSQLDKPDPPEWFMPHVAVHDAAYQVVGVQAAYKKIRGVQS
jgi:exodeoxyribonuclease VIII